MRITRLHLKDVKRHADVEFELAEGLTIIRGPNESGKSTIQRAIEIALFRRATSAAQELDGVRRWGATSDATIIVEFEDEGIRGRLAKTFAGTKGTVELTTEQGVERDPTAVDHVISSLTGLPSERFFLATASVRHHDLADLKQDEGTLRDRLQQSMSGATRGTHAVKRKLEEAIRRYKSEGPKNPGHLKVARSEVERLEAEVAHGEEALRRLEADRRALVEARGRRAALDAELAEAQRALAASERAVALARRGAEAQQRYTSYRRAAELRDELSQLEGEHPTEIPLDKLRRAVERLRDLEYRLSEIRAELASEPDLFAYQLALPAPHWQRRAVATLVLMIAAAAALVGGFVADQLLLGLVGWAVLGALALLGAVATLRGRRRAAEVQLQNELREHEITRRLRGRSQRADDLRETERERNEVLTTLALPDVAAAESLHSAVLEHIARMERLAAEYRGVLAGEEPAEDVAVLRDRAAAEVDECRHALAGLGEIGAQPAKSLATSRAAVERLRAERDRALAAESQAEGRLGANATDAEEVALASEALALAAEQLAQVQRRLRIYEHTLAALQAAERATMKKAARFLEQSMARDIARISDGRYRRLLVDENDLAFKVYSVERREWVDARELSRGTLDQLYLCARLGIVRQVTAPASPPLIFDDPFVTFDAERALRALALLKDAAAELQIIYLTCTDRYDELADKVIELAAPAERDDAGDDVAEPPPAAPARRPRVGAPAA